MPIPSRSAFAEECVRHGLFLGVNAHYLVAVAELRSGIKDDTEGDRIGPYRVTQQEWDANRTAADLEIILEAAHITGWRRQCLFAALTAYRAQSRLLDQLGRFPSALELCEEQWPGQPAEEAKLQTALDATAKLIDPAMEKITEEKIGETSVLETVTVPATDPPLDPSKPVPAAGEEKFVRKAPDIMAQLIADFGLKDFQAAGILGNIGLECEGFNTMQEKKPLVPGSKGGFGWCQWTGSRRDAFEAFCKQQGLDTTSDPANYGFLKVELNSTHKSAITEIKKTANIGQAVRSFEDQFEKAKEGLEHFDRRDRWAKLAIDTFRAKSKEPDRLLPAEVMKILDPDLIHRVSATAKSGGTMFWVVDQFGEQGGQTLVRKAAGGAPEILAQDTTIFPLKPELGLPPAVQKALSAGLKPVADPHPETASPAAASDDEIARRVFEEAKKCDDTLVTRDVPNTNGGRVACAWAANEVVRRAIGKPIGGGLSTVEMGKVLRATHTQVAENQVGPGMVVISPTEGGNVGHVGIVGAIKNPASATLIYSNSSSRAVFSHAFTMDRWKAFYGTRKGLPVLFYALKK